MTTTELYRIRIALVQVFLLKHGYDGILLSRVDNYAMVTGGKRNFIYTYGDMGANSFFVSRDGHGCCCTVFTWCGDMECIAGFAQGENWAWIFCG